MSVLNDLRSYSRHWLTEFISAYKNEECLWQSKHPDYSNHSTRNKAYDKLIEKLKEVEPQPDRTMVVRKINSLRSAFRREYRKKFLNKDYGTRLWYYEKLLFIAEQNPRRVTSMGNRKRTLPIKLDENGIEQILDPEDPLLQSSDDPLEAEIHVESHTLEDDDVDHEDADNENHLIKTESKSGSNASYKLLEITALDTTSQGDIQRSFGTNMFQAVNNLEQHHQQSQQQQQNQAQHQQLAQIQQEFPTIQISREHLPFLNSAFSNNTPRPNDEYDAIGTNVASKLRNLNHTQRIIAEKLISDVLFSAQLDTLSVTTRLT